MLPLTEHPALHARISAFHNALLDNRSNVTGMDKTILVDPIRMHLTLGVMSLAESGPKSIETALDLLRSLKPSIDRLTSSEAMEVHINTLGVFARGDKKTNSDVLWAGTASTPETATSFRVLQAVSELVYKEFQDHGFVLDTRPLKLHCTLMNTTYRRPRTAQRIGFSFDGILKCDPAMSLLSAATAEGKVITTGVGKNETVAINLGGWAIAEIQLCTMGSKGPRGEYVSVGGISLTSS